MPKEDMRYHICPRDSRWAEYDGYGIFLTYVCDDCAKAKMAQFRPDIHERYEAAEPIEPEDGCAHDWVYTGTAYGGDDDSYHGEGRCYCSKCGEDGDA